MVKKGDTFKIGEVCQESGIYRLVSVCDISGKCEISDEQKTIPLAKGEKFPPCKSCSSGNVKWEFVKKA